MTSTSRFLLMLVFRICPALRGFALAVLGLAVVVPPAAAARRFPDIVLVTVDTLRYDRLSFAGYERRTSPAIDELMNAGGAFTQARVVEPLTTPSLCSMLTSVYPHEHGASRNGIPLRPSLASLPKVLAERGYRTAAFVGNWTLRDRLSGLGEHFGDYEEVFTRKRWLGMFNSEATAEDLTSESLAWVKDHLDGEQRWPFLIWVHYVEPHAPYRFHREHAARLGLDDDRREPDPSDRYDTEIAFVDQAIGRLFEGLRGVVDDQDLLLVLAADHGESLGEHEYWGHGRHLYDATLRVPMALQWAERIVPTRIDDLATNLDLAPTVLGLLGLPSPDAFRGHDWSARLLGAEAVDRPPQATFHQAHKGAARGGSDAARRKGLLEVGWIGPEGKEVLHAHKGQRLVFDVARDPAEKLNLAPAGSTPSDVILEWLDRVQKGLDASDRLPPPALDDESLEQLRALGYID